MTDTEPIGDDFVNSQYQDGGGEGGGEVALNDFIEGQYTDADPALNDQQLVATSWGCEYCEVDNSLDTTVCVGCGYDYAAADVVSE